MQADAQCAVNTFVRIPIGHHCHAIRSEGVVEQASCGGVGETPVITPPLHIISADLADAGKRQQRDPARPQRLVDGLDCVLEIKYKWQRLRKNHAIECRIRNACSGLQITHQRCNRIARNSVQDVRPQDAISSEPRRILASGDFKDPAFDIGTVGVQERFDIPAIDTLSAIGAESSTERRQSSHIAPTDSLRSAHGRGPRSGNSDTNSGVMHCASQQIP